VLGIKEHDALYERAYGVQFRAFPFKHHEINYMSYAARRLSLQYISFVEV